jgi:SAM-dependent methyltransferase
MLDERPDLGAVNRALSAESLEVVQEILPRDPMYAYSPDSYFEAGSRALRCIQLALLTAERASVTSILDFACGGGRVLRYLKAAYPEANLTACDLYPRCLAFCAKQFGAQTLVSSARLEDTQIGGPYDLIWVGSLFTHVGEKDWRQLLTMFDAALSPRGVLVFTAYGRAIADLLRGGRVSLSLTPEHREQILSDYDERGFGFFADQYPEMEHGDALAARWWVGRELDRFPDLSLLLYIEQAWLDQDVIACVKSSLSSPVAKDSRVAR